MWNVSKETILEYNKAIIICHIHITFNLLEWKIWLKESSNDKYRNPAYRSSQLLGKWLKSDKIKTKRKEKKNRKENFRIYYLVFQKRSTIIITHHFTTFLAIIYVPSGFSFPIIATKKLISCGNETPMLA